MHEVRLSLWLGGQRREFPPAMHERLRLRPRFAVKTNSILAVTCMNSVEKHAESSPECRSFHLGCIGCICRVLCVFYARDVRPPAHRILARTTSAHFETPHRTACRRPNAFARNSVAEALISFALFLLMLSYRSSTKHPSNPTGQTARNGIGNHVSLSHPLQCIAFRLPPETLNTTLHAVKAC